MTIIINVDDIRIIDWRVDTITRAVYVNFEYTTDTNEIFRVDNAVFWETMPTEIPPQPTGEPTPIPDNWYQLPAQYSQLLTDLTVDLRQGLLHLLG